MGRGVFLEEFASGPKGRAAMEEAAAEALDTQLKAAWAEGHAAGQQAGAEAAAKAHAEDQARLRQSLVEAIQDRKQENIEVQQNVLRDIGPFVRTLIGHLTPRLAVTGLADHIGGAVAAALAARPDPVPVVRCSPETAEALEIALADWEGLRLTADPALTPLEAEVHWDNGYDSINISTLLNQLDTALEATLGPAVSHIDHIATHTEDLANAG